MRLRILLIPYAYGPQALFRIPLKMKQTLTHQNPYGYKLAAVEPVAGSGGTEAILENSGE